MSINEESDKKDYLDGDHSLKNWFKFAWGNGYIILFMVNLALLITEIVLIDYVINLISETIESNIFGGLGLILVSLVPLSSCFTLVYKGFYQHWNDLKNGRSR